MPSLKPGRRANAITNSPVVRSLIRPVISILPASSASASTSSNAAAFLIPTQPEDAAEEEPPRKKLKKADSTTVTSYTEDDLPEELEKYWAQRHRLFWKYDEGIKMDLEGWYSVTPEAIAQQIAQRCSCGTIVDAFCGVGGNAIQFAMTCDKVIAIDTDETRLACARHNAAIYGVEDKIEFVHADFVEWAVQHVKAKERGTVEDDVEVVFLSPPWGGIQYASHSPAYTLERLLPVPGHELFALSRRITAHVAMYLPRNTDVEQVARLPVASPWKTLVDAGVEEKVEVEEEWMSGKFKAITAYFGDLTILSQT